MIESIRRSIQSEEPMHVAFGPNPFELEASVGRRGANDRIDVAKIETLLGKAGYLDLDTTEGPTGFYGARVENALKKFQRDGGLKTDGLVNPDGPTMVALRQQAEPDDRSNVPSLLRDTTSRKETESELAMIRRRREMPSPSWGGDILTDRPMGGGPGWRGPLNPPQELPPNEPEKPKDRRPPKSANENSRPFLPGGSPMDDFVREILRPIVNRRGNAATQRGNDIVAQECMKIAHEYSRDIEHIGGATPKGEGGKSLPEKYYRNIDTPKDQDGRLGSSFADVTFGLMKDVERGGKSDREPAKTANINTASEKRPGVYTDRELDGKTKLAKNIGTNIGTDIGANIAAIMPKLRTGDDEEEYRKKAHEICREVFEELIRPTTKNPAPDANAPENPMP